MKLSDSKQNIIKATEHLLQTHGLACLTTRKIAHEAKVAEGLIYHHFKHKAGLIYEVVQNRVSETNKLILDLPLKVGANTPLENLKEVLVSVYMAHYEIAPIVYSVFADRTLRTQTKEIIKEKEIGPYKAIAGLDVYLAAEQKIGRIAKGCNVQVIAKCLWMMTIQFAMLNRLMGFKPDIKGVRLEIHTYIKTFMKGFEAPSQIEATS